MEQQVEIFEPEYVRRFQCIADRCEDHCCHSWEVTLDKKSYKTVRKNRNPQLSAMVARNLELLRENDQRHARIKIAANADCPFLNSRKLCEIQGQCGHAALPRTCRSYPRSNSFFAGRVEMSLSLSCPEAARQILLNPDAFIFEQYPTRLAAIAADIHNNFDQQRAAGWLAAARDFCFGTILNPEYSVEQKLFVIGLYVRRAEPQLADAAALRNLGAAFAEPATAAQLLDAYDALDPAPGLLWEVFSTVANGIVGQQQLRTLIAGGMSVSDQRFLTLHQAVASALASGFSGAQAERAGYSIRRLQSAYAQFYTPFFRAHDHILRNYLLYQIYHYMFPLHATMTPSDCYRLIVVDFFMLRAYLCGLGLVHGELSEATVVELVQSYARKRQHARNFEQQIEALLGSAGADGPEAIFGLIKLAASAPASPAV